MNGFTSTSPYPVNEYLNDVFESVWKPMADTDVRSNAYRRQLERTYLELLNTIVNPTEKQLAAVAANTRRSDVVLYVLQHLNTIEAFCTQQKAAANADDINTLHYDDILMQVKKMREKYNKTN